MKIIELVDRIKKGETTARAQVERSLAKAQETEEYHALLSLTAERALQRADEIDERIKNGEDPGVLAGVPFVVKDNYLAFGAPTTAAAKMLENFQAPVQATVLVSRISMLLRTAVRPRTHILARRIMPLIRPR